MRTPRRQVWLLVLLALTACGDGAFLEVELVLAKDPDPLAGVAVIRLEASGPAPMAAIRAEAPLGRHEVRLPPIPPGPARVITVLGLDSDGVAIARGESAPFEVTVTSPARVTVPFARCTTLVYRDSDHDGYGDPAAGRSACSIQEGFVPDNTDCDDGDSRAHPGQVSFFDAESAGTHSFDFNCDGKAEPELGTLVACVKVAPSCEGDGWVGSVPACGQSGDFAQCAKGSCSQGTPTTKKQACR